MPAASQTRWVLLFLASGCGGAQVGSKAKLEADASEVSNVPAASAPAHAEATEQSAAAPAKAMPPALEELPRFSPELVREALDGTAAAVDERARLGLRLAAVDQGPDAPWILAIVNRGTEPVRVLPDLRTLTLTVTPPLPVPDPSKKRQAVARPAKPRTCALPRELVPSSDDERERLELAPGEGLIDSFDPRLYCLPIDGKTSFIPGATVEVRLGWPEKVKQQYRNGKVEKVPLPQQKPPFIAERALPVGSLPEAPAAATHKMADEAPPTDERAIKQLVAPSVELDSAYAARVELDEEAPLALLLTRGSDARTERDATLTVTLTNRSKKAQRVFFRREFLTFEVSGPEGLVACDPTPDQRAPDRTIISTLAPGRRLSATNRLIELCPQGALRTPGLYLIHARFDPISSDDAGRPPPFLGRVVTRKPALVRVRKGWGDLLQHDPGRIRVGSVHAE